VTRATMRNVLIKALHQTTGRVWRGGSPEADDGYVTPPGAPHR